jgi:hypothetical protein
MQDTPNTATQLLFEELDYREADGIEVSLVWNRADDSLAVLVFDRKLDSTLEIPVQREHALDAFRHPYAYAALQGLETMPAHDRQASLR